MTTPYDEYLNRYPNVRAAIRWEGVPYDGWAQYTPTHEFYTNLKYYYSVIEAGKEIYYSFLPDFAPPLTNGYMTIESASDLFLAHVAHSLWIEITQAVPWRLHNYDDEELALILGGSGMFRKGTGNASHLYMINENVSGKGMPMRPDKSYRFLTGTDPSIRSGNSFIRNNKRGTIWEVFRWLRDNLGHGTQGLSEEKRKEAYGYPGPQPIEKMFTRTVKPDSGLGPRYWVHDGCHGAAALVVWLLRVINIPARSWKTFIEDSQTPMHSGIDLPCEYLFSSHMDNFYAQQQSKDSTMEPWEIFAAPSTFGRPSRGSLYRRKVKIAERRYRSLRRKYLTAPGPGEQRARYARKFLAIVCLKHPTYFFVSAYWEFLIYHTTVFSDTLQANGYDSSEVDSATNVFAPKLQAAIDAYKIKNPGLSDANCLEAYKAAYTAWDSGRGMP